MSAIWINFLNESASRLHKEDVLRKALTNATIGDKSAERFLNLVKKTYDPYATFGVKQVTETEGITNAENPWDDFFDLLSLLQTRELTGNAARDALNTMSVRFDSEEWNKMCVAVIRKDLRAGISDKTFNKICKDTDFEIPIFGCQLASSCEDRPEMRGVKRLEPKLDGVRTLMFCFMDEDQDEISDVIAYSRNGKIFENFTKIEDQIRSKIGALSTVVGCKSFILDGEIVSSSFQNLMRQARRKDNVQTDDSVYHIFDIIPYTDFINGFWNASLRKRIDILQKCSKFISSLSNVKLLKHIDVDLDSAAGKDQFTRYCSDMVTEGYEGVMIKSLDAPYECGRNKFWLKYKPVISVDLEIIDVEEGTGRNKGRMGALVCSGVDHGKKITVNVGSGFSDSNRTDYWINRDIVIGKTAEILCDVITKNQDCTYSLRFPRFLRFRDDK